MNRVPPKIDEARYASDYRIWIRFADGIKAELDLEPELWGDIFEPLRDKALFAQFKLYPERSTIFWPERCRSRAGVFVPKSCHLPQGEGATRPKKAFK